MGFHLKHHLCVQSRGIKHIGHAPPLFQSFNGTVPDVGTYARFWIPLSMLVALHYEVLVDETARDLTSISFSGFRTFALTYYRLLRSYRNDCLVSLYHLASLSS